MRFLALEYLQLILYLEFHHRTFTTSSHYIDETKNTIYLVINILFTIFVHYYVFHMNVDIWSIHSNGEQWRVPPSIIVQSPPTLYFSQSSETTQWDGTFKLNTLPYTLSDMIHLPFFFDTYKSQTFFLFKNHLLTQSIFVKYSPRPYF